MTTVRRAASATKIERLRRLMESRALDAIVVSSYQNVSYFAGSTITTQVSLPDRLGFLIARRDGAATLLFCNIEISQLKTQTDIEDVREYVEFAQNPTEELARILRELGLTGGSIGIDARRLPAASMTILQRDLPASEFVPIDDELELSQAVKDPDETEKLEDAAKSSLAAIEDTLQTLPKGTTERDVSSAIYLRLMQSGGKPLFMVFASGERTLQAHPESTDTPMPRGILWRIDYGARFDGGINSDLARTGVVGAASPEQEATLKALRATQDAGFRAIEPGRPAKDVFFAVRDEFKRQGLAFTMPHVGHGMGIGLHEYPMLEPGNDTPLEVGMVLNVEPMALITSRREGYHTEDLAAVTENGRRLLTPPQERLLIIPG
jgi:Xaa-Pro aminopeptidase